LFEHEKNILCVGSFLRLCRSEKRIWVDRISKPGKIFNRLSKPGELTDLEL